MNSRYLINIDFVRYLKRLSLIGQVAPTSKNDIDNPRYSLLCTTALALEHCQAWSNQDIPEPQFKKYLRDNGISYGDTEVESIMEIETAQRPRSKPKLVGQFIVSHKSKLLDVANALSVSKDRVKKYSDQHGCPIMEGRLGHIYTDGTHWYVYPLAKSKRGWTGIKAKLRFMELYRDGGMEGEFRLARLPSEYESETIRELLGLKKRPT